MKAKKYKAVVICLVAIFLITDIIVASFVFNSTSRENSPDWTLFCDEDILTSDFSGTGNAFVYGSGNSIFFHHIFNPNSSRFSILDAPVRQVFLSNNSKFCSASDMENNIYLFSYGGGPEMKLLYKAKFDTTATIVDLIVIGKTIQTTRLLVYSGNTIYVFDSTSPEPLWSWTFDDVITSAEISHYGDVIAVGTASGSLHVFRTFEERLVWENTCDSKINAVASSPFALFLVAGTSNGSVYLYDIKNADLIWKESFGYPIKKACIRSSATECLVQGEGGAACLFDKNSVLINHLEDVEVAHISFWGEYLAVASINEFSMFRGGGSVAEWVYEYNEPVRFIHLNYGATYVMLTYKDSIKFFIEDQLIIFGSRTYWSFLAIIIVLELLILLYIMYAQKGTFYSIVKNREFIEFFIGAAGGLLVVFALSHSTGSLDVFNLVVGMFSAGIASWQCSRMGGGFVGAFGGYVSAFFSSLSIGGAFGIYYWLNGLEQNIISSLFGTALFGGLLGTVFGLIGVLIGLFVKGYFEEYRMKKSMKK